MSFSTGGTHPLATCVNKDLPILASSSISCAANETEHVVQEVWVMHG